MAKVGQTAFDTMSDAIADLIVSGGHTEPEDLAAAIVATGHVTDLQRTLDTLEDMEGEDPGNTADAILNDQNIVP